MAFASDRPKRRVRFERNAARIVLDPTSQMYVVTWEKCGLKDAERLNSMRDPLKWLPSVLAVAMLYDRGCVRPDQIVAAAKSIGRAWSAGDREMLDTESAKKAAELVHDLATMCVDPSSPSVSRDIGQAMRRLLDEIAAVRFLNVQPAELDEKSLLETLSRATEDCFAIPEFASWSNYAMRKKFLYSLRRQERTELVYSLVALLFDIGSCPILSLSDRRTLRMQALTHSDLSSSFRPANILSFFQFVLEKMRKMKEEGRSTLGDSLTPQQLADSLTGSSPV